MWGWRCEQGLALGSGELTLCTAFRSLAIFTIQVIARKDLHQIFLYLHCVDIIKCESVCRRWKIIADDDMYYKNAEA